MFGRTEGRASAGLDFSLPDVERNRVSLSSMKGKWVYLAFVRPVLRRGGIYRALWPAWLDLEDSVYRPLLLKVLPTILGAPARLFGENMLLRPLCRGLVLTGSVAGRALDTGTDALILGLRRTLLREEPVRDGRSARRSGGISILFRAVSAAFASVVDNFSFAMMIACAGIVLVFLLLLIV